MWNPQEGRSSVENFRTAGKAPEIQRLILAVAQLCGFTDLDILFSLYVSGRCDTAGYRKMKIACSGDGCYDSLTLYHITLAHYERGVNYKIPIPDFDHAGSGISLTNNAACAVPNNFHMDTSCNMVW